MRKSSVSFAFFALLIQLFSIATPHSASAQLSLGNENEPPKVTAQLIAEHDSVTPGKAITLAIRQDITPQWHTYWSNPGDTGLATSVTWDLPEGITAGALQFPTPHRQPMSGMVNYGYENSVMLLADISAADTLPVGKPVTIKAKVNWLVCQEICIPESADLSLTLDVRNDPATGPWASAFTAARKSLPQTHQSAQHARIDDKTLIVTLNPMPIATDTVPEEAYFFPHDGLLIEHAAPQKVVFDGRSVIISVPLSTSRSDAVETVSGDIWLRSATGEESFTFSADVPKTLQEAAPVVEAPQSVDPDTAQKKTTDNALVTDTPHSMGFFTALFFAFLGGIILNLMPCVFPVLSLKALGLVHKAHQEKRRSILIGGASYLAGVLATFTLIGLVLTGFKAAGVSFGWGAQLQSPNFVSATSILLFFIGFYLIGGVTFTAGRLQNMGSHLAAQSNWIGSFFTGALAVLVATPCTAPFMGGAIFYALTQNTLITLLVLWALGFGLALPYVLLVLFPNVLLRYVPKPGIWMEHFKQFLAFPMWAAAIWLVWVLAQQTGAHGVVLTLTAMLLLAFGFWLWNTIQNRATTLWQIIKAVLAFAAIIVALVTALSQPAHDTSNSSATQTAHADYAAYSLDTLQALRAQGKPVFINMTAAWCVTCLANEKAALSTETVKNFFKENGITYLKGDWTNQDPVITEYLHSFGRSGVPLYVFYPADQSKAPIVLPQLLTPSVVMDKIQPSL